MLNTANNIGSKSSYLGVDVGSMSTNLVLIDEGGELLKKVYLRTSGKPIEAIREGMQIINEDGSIADDEVKGVGVTGSGRQLAGVILGADIVKNEITAHAVAASKYVGDVKTVLEIGGQDSKLIIIRDGMVRDFAMNTVCAAGTGSFLDRQAERLGIPISEFGGIAMNSTSPVRIAGRCAVFAESDMIHKQQTGNGIEDILAGLCQSLVRNFLNNLAKGKEIEGPVLFQGGVAANQGMVNAFKEELAQEIIVPPNYDVMGAYGAALLAKDEMNKNNVKSRFCGFGAMGSDYKTTGSECRGCSNMCEIVVIEKDGAELARFGGRCERQGRVV